MADPQPPREEHTTPDERQCRICLDGEDQELGRLIRPCLCKGSVSVSSISTSLRAMEKFANCC
jgi:E3 ubiquitin-protein ligase DOA10